MVDPLHQHSKINALHISVKIRILSVNYPQLQRLWVGAQGFLKATTLLTPTRSRMAIRVFFPQSVAKTSSLLLTPNSSELIVTAKPPPQLIYRTLRQELSIKHLQINILIL